jgi:CRISPR/Cas system-associated exonuclease Cas4 (RecB family)
VTEALFSVTDAKHFLYCPRIVFFERVLHAAPRLGFSRRKTSGSTGS